MRIRRSFSAGTRAAAFREWFHRVLGPPAARLHRFLGRIPLGGHRFGLVAAGLFAGTLVAGYLFAALVLFPAPIFAASRSVPRVIGQHLSAAGDGLAALGLEAVQGDAVAHPSIPQGSVVWQDPPPDVVVPEGTEVRLTVSAGPQRIPVPDVAGYDAANARLLIESAGLRIGSIESAQAPTPANVAVNTRPPAGTSLLPGSELTLVVSLGTATIRVPSLIGLSLDSARLVLEDAGLALGTNYARRSTAAAAGQVFFQDPAPGTLSAPGARVNVVLASGNPP